MEIDQIGAGIGGGSLLGAILTWLGFKTRIDSLEKRIENYHNEYVQSGTCNAVQKGVDQRFEGIDQKLNQILEILMERKKGG